MGNDKIEQVIAENEYSTTFTQFPKQSLNISATSYQLLQQSIKTNDLLKQLHHFKVRGQQHQQDTFQYLEQTVQQVSQILNQISQCYKTFITIHHVLQQIELAEKQLDQDINNVNDSTFTISKLNKISID